MAEHKFTIGDKVRLTARTPKWVVKELILFKSTRTVVGRFYDDKRQCCFYWLGGRGRKQNLEYGFRSYMLRLVARKELEKIGRPRGKRRYNLATKVAFKPHNGNLGQDTLNQVSEYPEGREMAMGVSL